jgi:eukaryotic-like serine/threonine-protein kinase
MGGDAERLMPEKIGPYHIVERIGRGGMGTIFKAHDPIRDRLVALKVMSTGVEASDERRARFHREFQACARLSHPNIIAVYAMDEDGGRLFIVMELLEGEELKRLIAQRTRMALEDKLSVMVQVCDGLHYAHQMGVVHRDIKPGNIFLLRSGQVKILDFGIAKVAGAEGGLTRAGQIVGSPRYISPEQVRGRVDHRSDIFSAGAVFYEFLSMRRPFTGSDPVHLLEQIRTEEPPALDQLDPTIPPALAAVVARAMRKDPTERFADIEQMRSQLEEIRRGLPGREASEARRREREEAELTRQMVTEVGGGAAAADAPSPAAAGRRGTKALDSPAARIEGADAGTVQNEVSAALAGPRAPAAASTALARTPGAPAPALRRWWPAGWRTTPATGVAVADIGKSGSGSRWGLKRVAAVALGGLAVIGLGALLWLARAPWTSPGPTLDQPPSASPTAPAAAVVGRDVEPVPPPSGLESAAGRPAAALAPVESPAVPGAADPAAVPPLPPAVDRPRTSRQAMQEVLEARDPAHAVTATVAKRVVRIGRDPFGFSISSSRPGYVYVMRARGSGSDVQLLFPNAVEKNNHVEPGQPLKIPGPRWPLRSPGPPGTDEFLAIVSDEPRDFSALGPATGDVFKRFRLGGRPPDRGHPGSMPLLAGAVACASATRCSQSYGAVAFTIETVAGERAVGQSAGRPTPPAPATPARRYDPEVQRRPPASPRCSGILERASLGDPLTDEEQAMLTRDCR